MKRMTLDCDKCGNRDLHDIERVTFTVPKIARPIDLCAPCAQILLQDIVNEYPNWTIAYLPEFLGTHKFTAKNVQYEPNLERGGKKSEGKSTEG